ncbi:Programmed cell death protein 7 [Trinorchestia longiramus]|nr:Programmed cell death protein 7 [Trinorchestia longiramus]
MSRPPPRSSLLQPQPFGIKFDVPPPGNRFQPPPGNRFQPPSPSGNRFQPPPSGNRFQPPPSGNGFQPYPPAEQSFQLPRANRSQPPPSGNRFLSPPPGSMLMPLPPRSILQQPPPRNMLQQPPPRNMLQQPPPRNMLQQPPPRSILQQPPPRNMLQQPPSRNMLQQSPPRNMLQQPPPRNMLQQPPPRNMLQRPPPSRSMFEASPSCILEPLPTSLGQPPRMVYSSHPSPRDNSRLVPPQQWLHSTSPSESTPGNRKLPSITAPQNAPCLKNTQHPPPRPSHPSTCVASPSDRPISLLYENQFLSSSANRHLPLPVHHKLEMDATVNIRSSSNVVSNASSGPSIGLWSSISKPLSADQISSTISTSKDLFPCSSEQFRGCGIETISSTNTIPKMLIPLSSTISFSMPPPSVTKNIDCSTSTHAYAASPHLSVHPPNLSSHSNRTHLMSNIYDQPESDTNKISSSSIEIPRHPLNVNWVSCTKLQSIVDEWVSKKLNVGKTTGESSSGPDQILSRRGHREDSSKIGSSGVDDQGSEDLKEVLEESGFQGRKWNLLSSLLPLLNKQYRDFRLLDVHTSVASYTLLLEELKNCSDDARRAKIKKLLDPIKCILSDENFQEIVKKLVSARTKKRQRRKRRKVSLKQEWDHKSKLIDARREELHRLEHQKLQEVKLRVEVDAVLKEVRGKQEEAESLQTLLWTLRDLRQHRLNRGEQQGYVSSQQDDDCFNKVTDGLEKMIETQLSDYSLEERTLQAMLQSTHPPAASVAPTAVQSQVADSDTFASMAEELLFGRSTPGDDALYASYCAADTSLEMLVARRRAWDKHIVNKDTGYTTSTTPEEGSGIPVCWVLPPVQPALQWRRYLAP